MTLLKYFRNYLLDQQRIHSSGEDILSSETGGFPASITTGSQSDLIISSSNELSSWVTINNVKSIPYLKKWIKTRHAVLFRLSNKTVQVVFYDKSELLLSSEANSIIFVNKEGIKSECSLQETIQSGIDNEY